MNPFRPLHPGSLVQVVAPSGVVPRDPFLRGCKVLESWGLRVRFSPRIFHRSRYLAGPDPDRAREWQEAFQDPEVEGVLAARGGYGAMRILDRPEARSTCARLFLGFSDVTALHLLRFHLGFMGIHGSNVTTLGGLDAESLARTRGALLGEAPDRIYRWEGLRPLREGRAEGRVVAGNLSLLGALMGTPFEAPMEGCLWVVEDVHEPPYRLDRLLTQVLLARGSERLGGLVIGDLGVDDTEAREAVEELLRRSADRLRCPVVAGFPMGHRGTLHPLPVGAMARLDADRGTLEVIEDPGRG